MAYAQNFEVQPSTPSRKEQRAQRRAQRLSDALMGHLRGSTEIVGREGMGQVVKIARAVLEFEPPTTDSVQIMPVGDYDVPVRVPTQEDAEYQLLQNLTPLETRLYGHIRRESSDRRLGKYGVTALLSRYEAGLSPEDGSEASTTEQVSA